MPKYADLKDAVHTAFGARGLKEYEIAPKVCVRVATRTVTKTKQGDGPEIERLSPSPMMFFVGADELGNEIKDYCKKWLETEKLDKDSPEGWDIQVFPMDATRSTVVAPKSRAGAPEDHTAKILEGFRKMTPDQMNKAGADLVAAGVPMETVTQLKIRAITGV